MKSKIIILAIFLLSTLSGFAQDILLDHKIEGKIVDSRGNPVSGALISVVNNPSVTSVSDKDGHFSITAVPNNKLSIQTPSFDSKTIEIKDNKQLLVRMDLSSQAVDLGFGIRQTVGESTSAISRATADQIDTRSSFSLSNSLYGNALGLTSLQGNGMAWDNFASFSIRGLQTLSDNGILVLVDGFERSITAISPEEIESVSVLRDAAAVALYGYRGINGILSVRTKRGKLETREIKVSYDHAFTSIVRPPKFVDAYKYANAYNEALINDGKTPKYSQNELNAFSSGQYPSFYPNVDWYNEVFKDNGASNTYSISFRGGGKKMKYYTMLNLQNNDGFIKNADYSSDYNSQMKSSKANIRTNLDIELTPSTMMEVGMLGYIQETTRPGLGSDNMMTKLYTVPSSAFPVKTYNGVWGGNSTWGENMNPVALAVGRGVSKGHTRALNADIKLTQKLDFVTKGLSASARLGYDNVAAYWEGRIKSYAYASDAVNLSSGVPTDTVRTSGGTVGSLGFDNKLDWQNRHFNIVGNVDYTKTMGQQNLFASFIYSFDKYINGGQHNTYNRQNFAGYFHYDFDKRYIADLALVLAGSNRLPAGNHYAFSPTVSAAWVASNEDFFKDIKFIEFLKFRMSAGIINTDYIPEVGIWEQSFGSGGGYPLGSNYDSFSGMSEGRFATANIRKERGDKYNFGIDAAFLNGFTLSADVYYEQRKNIFVTSTGLNSVLLGASLPYLNAGKVNSYGTEIGLDYNKKISDFTFFAGGKFTLSKNKIKEQLEEAKPYEYLESTGRSIGQIWGLQAVGYFVDQADIENSARQQFSDVKPGDIKYKDQNGDGIINEYDAIPMGYNTSVPEIYYSFNIGAEWKGLGFNATFQGVSNYSVMRNTTAIYKPFLGETSLSEEYYDNRWTPENPFAKYPRLTTEANDNNYRNNSVWIQDASFLKLRNCELYYKFPVSTIAPLKMSSAKLYVRGVDLLSFDKIDISDPEVVGISYPVTRSIHVGFAVEF